MAAYLGLPDQAGYLIPVIPATLLPAAGFVPRFCFQLCCLCLAIAPWLELGRNGLRGEQSWPIAAMQIGYRIFDLPAIRFFNLRVNRTDLARYGQDLFALYQAKASHIR